MHDNNNYQSHIYTTNLDSLLHNRVLAIQAGGREGRGELLGGIGRDRGGSLGHLAQSSRADLDTLLRVV